MSRNPLAILFGLEILLAAGGAVWMRLAHYPFISHPDPWGDAILALIGYTALIGLEGLAELVYPAGYRELDRLMHHLGETLKNAGVGYNTALMLAFVSAVGEELWFRGALQNFFAGQFGTPIGLLIQAGLFAAGHPAPGRAGRFYVAWAFVAGLIFGGLYLVSDSLIPGILAHFLYNAKGFSELYD